MREPVARQSGQNRGPPGHPPILFIRAEQSEAAAAHRHAGGERSAASIVHHAHGVGSHAQQAQAGERVQTSQASGTETPGAPTDHHREPLIARPPTHGPGGHGAARREDEHGRSHPGDVRFSPQDEHADHQPRCHGEDLPGPPPSQGAPAFTGTEAVSGPFTAHDDSGGDSGRGWRGGSP